MGYEINNGTAQENVPIIGILTGGLSFSDLSYLITPAVYENGVEVAPANTLNYGLFIDNTINFFIIAFSIFLVIKAINKARKRFEKQPEEETTEEAVALSSEELLVQIRDILKDQKPNATVSDKTE